MQIRRDNFLSKLKTSKIIRGFVYPICFIEHRQRAKKYMVSGCGEKLNIFKNRYSGERCFIIGNGPSLVSTDLDKLKNEYTFAANRISLIFDKTAWRPTFYTVVDSNVFEGVKDTLNKIEAEYFFIDCSCKLKNAKIDFDRTFIIYSKTDFYIDANMADPPFISEDLSSFLSDGRTVTFAEIQLAIFMGFKEIYLLGVDHNFSSKNPGKHHFDGDSDKMACPSNLISQTMAYQAAEDYSKENNIKIFNATRGGELEVFERIDFDSIIIRR